MFQRRYWTLVAPLAVFMLLALPLRGGFTDDAFIHIRYAENIIEHGEYSFNRGEVSFGTTSPLWVLIQAALGKLIGGGERLIHTSRILSWLGGFLTIILVFALARNLGVGPWAAYLSALVFAAHCWFVRWTALGMETSTAVLAVTAAGIAAVRADVDRRSAVAAGFFMAVAGLLRPEAYLLLPVYLVALSSRGKKVDRVCAAYTFAVYTALLLPWLVFARVYIGSLLPNTAGAKSGGLVLHPLIFLTKFEPVLQVVGSAEGIEALLIVASLGILRTRSRLITGPFRFLLLWIVALPIAYVLFDIQILSRYLLLVSPFTVVLGFAALEELIERFGSRTTVRRSVLAAAALAAALINIAFYFRIIVPPTRAFSSDLTHKLKRLALFTRDHSSEDAVIAAADIGYLAFYSDRRVLDLGGLVERETGDLREQYTYEEIIERGLYLHLPRYPHVEFFIDRDKEAERFRGRVIEGYRFEALHTEVIDNLGIRKPGPFYYTLYRLHPE